MNIIFTTLSLGEPYTRDYCLKLINDVLQKTTHSIAVTTDCANIIFEKYGNNPRIIIKKIQRNDLTIRINTDWGVGIGNDFNFNMRYLCFEDIKDLEDYVVIFTDCDNSLDWWDESEIQKWLESHIEKGFDFFAPRNDLKLSVFLKEYNNQKNIKHGIFWHKLYNYDLIDHPKPEWDDSPLPAEYLLIFYNKDKKLQKFYDQWKWFHDYLVERNKSYGTWAEGFEIGVSSLVAGMVPFDIGWCHPVWKRAITPNGYKIGHPTEGAC
jgi:hypothetical protein